MEEMPMDEIMTIKEVSRYLKMNERTISKLASQGLIPAAKIANQWRFMRTLINQWLEQRMVNLSADQLEALESEIVSAPVEITSFLSPAYIIPESEAREKVTLLREMVNLASGKKLIRNPVLLLRALLRRESLCSTAIGDEVAIPHPRHPLSDSYLKPMIIMARSSMGVDFNAIDDLPVKLVFLLCLPDDYVHLKVLARLTRILKDSDFRDALKAADGAATLYDLIQKKDEQLNKSRLN
jgi:PTS system nitrogen regulatory IIA component